MISEIFQRERFNDPAEAAAFLAHSNNSKFRARSFFMYAGVLLYASYAYLDYLVAGNLASHFILLRLMVISPLMLALAYAYSNKYFEGNENGYFLAYMSLMIGSVLYMCLILEGTIAQLYPFGLVVITFSMSLLLMVSFQFTLLMSCLTIIAFTSVTFYSSISSETAYTYCYFVGSCCCVLSVGMFFLENSERRQFVYKRELERTIGTLKKSEQRAVDLYHDAKQAERAKNEFLAVVSHELRTPMNAIIGFSEIIATEMLGKVSPVQYGEYAVHINKSGLNLLNIINDILDISRADMDKLSFAKTEFDIHTAVYTALNSCSANAEEAGITIVEPEKHMSDVLIHGDESRIVQAVVNIIGNAIKFSEHGSSINPSISFTENGGLAISVTDSGIGISPEDIQQIRKPFQQAESAFARNNGGLGLGLAICNIIALAHDGEIEITSELGVGTTVSLMLPPECIVADSSEIAS